MQSATELWLLAALSEAQLDTSVSRVFWRTKVASVGTLRTKGDCIAEADRYKASYEMVTQQLWLSLTGARQAHRGLFEMIMQYSVSTTQNAPLDGERFVYANYC